MKKLSASSHNIAICLLPLSPKSPTGVFTYVKNLLENLDDIDNFYLLVKLKDYWYFKKRYQNIQVKIIDVRLNIKTLFARKNRLFKQKILTKQIQKFIEKKHIDTIFFPATYIYPVNQKAQALRPKIKTLNNKIKKAHLFKAGINRVYPLKKVKIVTMVCDLQHEYFPKNFSPEHLKQRREGYKYAVLNSDHIIAISNHTKKTIIEKYNIKPGKITTIYLGVNKINPKPILLPKNFIFYPAAFWPHKNHKILIKALNELKNEFLDLSLAFTGKIIKEKIKKEIGDLIKKYELSKRVVFLDYVPDEELSYIYQKAKALVFPSSFEGFGLPIIESFKYKLPVIAANNTSIKEIVGDAGLLFETNDLKMLVECIKKILLNHKLREQLINKGLERVKNFTWQKTAKKTLLILKYI